MKRLDPKINEILKKSFKESNRLGGDKIDPDHLMLSILDDEDNVVIDVLKYMGSDIEDLMSKIEGYIRLKVKNPSSKKNYYL